MGSVASFKTRQESCRRGTHLWFLGGQPEQFSDEPDLTPNIIAPQPPNLPLPDHVHRLIALNRS